MRQDPKKETKQMALTLMVLAAVVAIAANVFILVELYSIW
jgi:hypothetical protein